MYFPLWRYGLLVMCWPHSAQLLISGPVNTETSDHLWAAKLSWHVTWVNSAWPSLRGMCSEYQQKLRSRQAYHAPHEPHIYIVLIIIIIITITITVLSLPLSLSIDGDYRIFRNTDGLTTTVGIQMPSLFHS